MRTQEAATTQGLRTPHWRVRFAYRVWWGRVPDEYREWVERDLASPAWGVRMLWGRVGMMLMAFFAVLALTMAAGAWSARGVLGFVGGWAIGLVVAIPAFAREAERTHARVAGYQRSEISREQLMMGWPGLATAMTWTAAGAVAAGAVAFALYLVFRG
ncbi:MAG TPA: hypothetical protein VNE62_08115 [Actinomycetota bacterium]|nr:hypothetical protein [Actinomycetota bacterium]